jgi:proteasome lid subunit RPN8/RPN11
MVHILEAALRNLRAHAGRSYPHESCGALLGTLNNELCVIHEAVEVRNAAEESTLNRYRIDPVDLIKIERQARQMKLSVVGFYHSHPDSAPVPSQTDLLEAHWLGCAYLITSVHQGCIGETVSCLLEGTSEENKSFVAHLLKIIP